MSDRDIGDPDPLRMKVFLRTRPSTDERLAYLIEVIAELDERLKELENAFTNYMTRDVS